MLLAMPWSGILFIWLGIRGVDKKSLNTLMKNKKCFDMMPGGFEEASLYKYGEDSIFLKNRKGWVKLAL